MLNRDAVEGTDRYVVTCLYGLEGLLADEVQERLHVPGERHWSEVAFHYGGDPRHVGALRLAGNVFLCIDRVRIGPSLADLAPLTDRLRALPLARWERLAGAFHDEAAGEIGIRVDRKGKHRFTYAQVEELALEAVATATGRRTTLEDRPLQLKVDVHNEWCRLLARLTVRSLAVRDYRRCHARSATDPTLAAAMVRMTEPRGDDVFLDPFCGTGSVAIERCLAGAAQRVVAGERNERRIGWARTNAQAAGADVQFACWDAAALPFADRTFSAVAAVPPQSEPSGGRRWRPEELAPLVQESLRVLRFEGRMVWLMQQGDLLPEVLKRVAPHCPVSTLACNWKGRHWTLYRIEKSF